MASPSSLTPPISPISDTEAHVSLNSKYIRDASSINSGFSARQLHGTCSIDTEDNSFQRGLQTALGKRANQGSVYEILLRGNTVDFCSNDSLSLSASGQLRARFEQEIDRHRSSDIGTAGSRVLDGTCLYPVQLEDELAQFYDAEAALIFNSGFEANVAIFTVLPQPGDVIIYDELIHASIHDGMRASRATDRIPFGHNDVASLSKSLVQARASNSQLVSGKSTAIVSIESVYSMDGDIAPLESILRAGRALFPLGNIQFFIDEAHSNGLLGPQGRGLVSQFGLERDVSVRMHPFSKALASNGAVILSSKLVKSMLVNFSRSFVYSTPPSFLKLASIRAGLNTSQSTVGDIARASIRHLVLYFYDKLTSHNAWDTLTHHAILKLQFQDTWSTHQLTHIVALRVRDGDSAQLAKRLLVAGMRVSPVKFPIVAKGAERIRLIFHAGNNEEQVDKLIAIMLFWAGQRLVDLHASKQDSDCCSY